VALSSGRVRGTAERVFIDDRRDDRGECFHIRDRVRELPGCEFCFGIVGGGLVGLRCNRRIKKIALLKISAGSKKSRVWGGIQGLIDEGERKGVEVGGMQ